MFMDSGLIHIYCGDGKGKSTAVMGLALRAAGSGRKVVLPQFLKDGKSSELNILKGLPQVTVLTCQKQFGFFWNMTEEQKTEARAAYQELFDKAVAAAREAFGDEDNYQENDQDLLSYLSDTHQSHSDQNRYTSYNQVHLRKTEDLLD